MDKRNDKAMAHSQLPMENEVAMNDVAPGAENTGGSPPTRLMITKMEIENFKSYAGVKEIGPFHKCFSSVVGPNGSGKSNVIDAMLFVFGKRAKKLRLNKVSELIHKSDAVKDNPPQSARVSVFFQEIIDTYDETDNNSYIVVPGSHHVVTRIAKRDNSSVYRLDGKNCHFKLVADYLGSKGIDLDNNRFLILQGEVEMISMMPPKGKTDQDEGLLEYLEDIIGSSKYVEETNQAAAQVDALTEVRQEKLNRVKAVQKEKDNLESAKLEAESLLAKDRDIRRKQNILYQIHAMNAGKEKEEHESKSLETKQHLEAEREKLKAAGARVIEIEKGLAKQKKEYDRVYEELMQTKEEFAEYERRDIKLKEETKHASSQVKKLEAKVQLESKNETEAIAKGIGAQENIPILEQNIEELKDNLKVEQEKIEEIHEDMKGKTLQLRTELETKTQELAPIQEEKATFQNNLDTAETEVKLLEGSAVRAKEQLKAAETELASLDEKKNLKRDQLASSEDELAQAQERIKEAESEEKQLEEKERQLSQKVKNLMERSEMARAMMQSQGGRRSKAVDGILKARRKGGELANVGVLGRLGDLATIPEEYDVAVSTACGTLDNIVVRTTAGAQKCLEFLRKHNLGRVTFIPLDKMSKGAHDRAVETPENAPRLFDLISPSTCEVTPAIYMGVQNTLVAPDLDTASRWAYDYSKRWRVVTLDGKLIDTAGTMSGGGNSVRRGGMKLANARSVNAPINEIDQDSEDLEKIEEETSKAQHYLQECRKRRKAIADEIRAIKKRVKAIEVMLPKIALDLSGFETTRDALTKQIPVLRDQCTMSAAEVAKLDGLKKVVSKCKTDMVSCTMMASKLEAEVARLQKAILDVGGPKLKKQKVTCDKLSSTLKDAEKQLNTAKVAVKTSSKLAQKAKKTKEAAEKELELSRRTLADKMEERESLAADATRVSEGFEKVKEIEAEKKKAFEEATMECELIRKSRAEYQVAEIELVASLESCEKQLAECQKKIAHWTQKIVKLKEDAEGDKEWADMPDDEDDDELHGSVEQAKDSALEEGVVEGPPENEAPACQKSCGSLPVLDYVTLEKYTVEEIQCQISVLETERNTIAKNANMGAIAEYRKKEADYIQRVAELDAVSEERDGARRKHEDLRRMRLEMFMDGFGTITLKLKEMYQMITLGGDAELELVDSLDPFSEGIVFSVRPPKKSWKNISNLSGGEKTLSSLALVFALHHFKPTPLYVMDEIDAALDFKNVSIVANYIKERTKNAQFIIISLRNNMFELADRLVGIYKTNNCTKSVTINPASFGVSGQQNGFIPKTPVLSEKTNQNSATGGSGSRRVSFRE